MSAPLAGTRPTIPLSSRIARLEAIVSYPVFKGPATL
jgi:hypothetical protein